MKQRSAKVSFEKTPIVLSLTLKSHNSLNLPNQLKEYGATGIPGELAQAYVIALQFKVGQETSLAVQHHAMAVMQRPLVVRVNFAF